MIRNSSKYNRLYQEWQALLVKIRNSTASVILNESTEEKLKRKKMLSTDFVKFCTYYFPHYLDSDFGWFHKKAAKEIEEDKNVFIVLEWAREHAKSVFADIFIPLYLYARNEFTGMVVVSANEDKASTLLSDVQAELVANERWKHDYGELAQFGDWSEGKFSTSDGIGFWAFGRGQSPRGIRKAEKRPNYAVVDDIDDKVIVRNDERVRQTVDWILEDLYGALSIKGARLVIAGNRIHKNAILSHLVGDIEPEDPKRPGIKHIKVFAIENPKTHIAADPPHGVPAWKERYSLKELTDKMEKMGYRASRREYFHEHHEEGHVFKNEWIKWDKVLNSKNYDSLIVYCDPSFKSGKDNDFKAIITIGKRGKYIDILDAWVRQTTTKAMVTKFYDLYDWLENSSRYYIEANMLQELLLDEFDNEADIRGYYMPIRGDKRNKPDKYVRIENLTPLFERGLVILNEAKRKDSDMQTFVQQLLGFPFAHDDAPDALEGGIFLIQKTSGRSSFERVRTGKYNNKSKRD
jgi:predicted phage terminase large subunit-like protein